MGEDHSDRRPSGQGVPDENSAVGLATFQASYPERRELAKVIFAADRKDHSLEEIEEVDAPIETVHQLLRTWDPRDSGVAQKEECIFGENVSEAEGGGKPKRQPAAKPQTKLLGIEAKLRTAKNDMTKSILKTLAQIEEDEDLHVSVYSHIDRARKARRLLLVLPNSTGKMRWNAVLLLSILVTVFLEPYSLTLLTLHESVAVMKRIMLVCEFIFGANMLLTFFTCLEKDGETVYDRREIFTAYIQLGFWVDLLSFIPTVLPLVELDFTMRLLVLFKLLRLLKLGLASQLFGWINPSILAAIKRVLVLIIVWHWFACGYWFLTMYEGFTSALEANDIFQLYNVTIYKLIENGQGEPTVFYLNYWLPSQELQEQGLLQLKYSWSFFWAIMATTGLGRDIKPTSESEYLFSICIIFFGLLVYAFIIGGITNAFNEVEAAQREERAKISSIERFMKKQRVPKSLEERVRGFAEYEFSKGTVNSDRYKSALSDLHASLSLELRVSLQRSLLAKNEVIAKIENPLCLVELVEMLEPRTMIPEEIVYEQGDSPDGMYLSAVGKLDMYANSRFLLTLQPGSLFGEMSLLLNQVRNSTVVSPSFADVLYLSTDKWIKLIRLYPEFYELLQENARSKTGSGWKRVSDGFATSKTPSFLTALVIQFLGAIVAANSKDSHDFWRIPYIDCADTWNAACYKRSWRNEVYR